MFNEELYKKLEQYYGVKRMIDFAEIMTTRYDVLYDDIIFDGLTEDNIQRDWWFNKYVELKTIPENRMIKEGLNKIDDTIINLQKELTESVNCLEELKLTLKEKGYNLSEI